MWFLTTLEILFSITKIESMIFFFFFVRSTLLTHTHTNLQVQRLQKWQAIKNVKTVVLIRLLGPRNDVLMLGKLIILGVS